jgi:hypothetical protein
MTTAGCCCWISITGAVYLMFKGVRPNWDEF